MNGHGWLQSSGARRCVPGLVFVAGLAACTRTTELLPKAQDIPDAVPKGLDAAAPPRDAIVDAPPTVPADAASLPRGTYAFCPTSVDVYAGTNGLFPGCGGGVTATTVGEEGLFSPGTETYDATLAGRLLARLAGDPDLVPRFGTAWTVRSCATMGQTLSQLVPQLTSDLCRGGAPEMMAFSTQVCSKSPARLMLLASTMSDDGCHGGGSGPSDRSNDPATYIQHYTQRMDTFLAARAPQVVLLGAQTEWSMGMSYSSYDECFSQRQEWDVQGVAQYAAAHATSATVLPMPDYHAEFLRHHPRCCRQGAESCLIPWYGKGETLNCDGAQIVVDAWYQQLKTFLMANDFECPASRIRSSPSD